MIHDINEVSTAIEILTRFIRLYDKAVAENFSLLLNPITRGDINGGLLALKKHLCQAADQEATTEKTTNKENISKGTDTQKVLKDSDSKLIYESFCHDFEKSATDFIAIYGANPDHFWNKLPLLSDGHIVSQLLKVLDHHSEMSDFTQRLLEIKLHEQVQLLEKEFVESNSTLRKGETIRSVALQRVLGHKASRAEDFKVDRGKKLSHFELIDLFRISKPHWTKWRKIKMAKVFKLIRRNLRPVQAAWAEDLADILSKIYQQIPSHAPFIPEAREGEAQALDSEVENSNLPISNFPTSADQAYNQADTLESRNDRTIHEEQNSSSAEAITSNKRPARDVYPLAAKRQRLGQVALPSQGDAAESSPQSNRNLRPSNDNSQRPSILDVSLLRDFGTQSKQAIGYQTFGGPLSDNSAAANLSSAHQPQNSLSRASTGTPLLHCGATIPQKQIQPFEARANPAQSSLVPVVNNSIYPDNRNIDPDTIDAIIASAEPRIPWPTEMDSHDSDPDLIDVAIASAEPRISWPTIDDIVPAEHGAYQWSPPNLPNNASYQHPAAAT